MTKRQMARVALEAYRHAVRFHDRSYSMDIRDDGYRMKECAVLLLTVLYGRGPRGSEEVI